MKKLVIIIFLMQACTAFAQKEIIYHTKNLPRPDTTWVFLPENLQPGEKAPVIFLLHGYSGNYKQWNSIMDAQKYANKYKFIIVCPDGMYNSWYVNSPVKADSQFETFFLHELWPDIVKKFNPDTSNAFISGLSMGGHGALTLFLKHPDKFKSAGSTSGVVDLMGVSNKYGMIGILGEPTGDNLAVWKSNSVVGNIEKLKGMKKGFIFDCGASDPFYSMNTELKITCDSLKIPATFISQPGGHSRDYWRGSIKQHFEYFYNLVH